MLAMETTLNPRRKTRAEWAEARKRTGHRTRLQPNRLRDWLEGTPRPMSKQRFAELLGCTAAYVSMLLADDAPWPGKELSLRIGIITEGVVTPNDLAGYPPTDD